MADEDKDTLADDPAAEFLPNAEFDDAFDDRDNAAGDDEAAEVKDKPTATTTADADDAESADDEESDESTESGSDEGEDDEAGDDLDEAIKAGKALMDEEVAGNRDQTDKPEDQEQRRDEGQDTGPGLKEVYRSFVDQLPAEPLQLLDGDGEEPVSLRELANDYPEVTAMIAMASSRAEQRIAQLENQLARQEFFSALQFEVPDYRQITEDNAFWSWLDKDAPAEVRKLHEIGGVENSARVIRAYKAQQARVKAQSAAEKADAALKKQRDRKVTLNKGSLRRKPSTTRTADMDDFDGGWEEEEQIYGQG